MAIIWVATIWRRFNLRCSHHWLGASWHWVDTLSRERRFHTMLRWSRKSKAERIAFIWRSNTRILQLCVTNGSLWCFYGLGCLKLVLYLNWSNGANISCRGSKSDGSMCHVFSQRLIFTWFVLGGGTAHARFVFVVQQFEFAEQIMDACNLAWHCIQVASCAATFMWHVFS